MRRIRHIIKDYNQHVTNNVPTTLFIVMLWIGAQTLIQELIKQYFPGYENWIVGALEVFVATIGLWYFTRSKKPKGKKKVLT